MAFHDLSWNPERWVPVIPTSETLSPRFEPEVSNWQAWTGVSPSEAGSYWITAILCTGWINRTCRKRAQEGRAGWGISNNTECQVP